MSHNAHLDIIKGNLGVKYVNCKRTLCHQLFRTAMTHREVKI